MKVKKMRKINALVSIVFLLISYVSLSQESRKGEVVYCPYDFNNTDFSHIPISEKVKANLARSGRAAESGNANIVVTYSGFTQEAQDAFQFAADIWASLLKSDVDIYVEVDFSALDPGAIGGAGPGTFFRGYDGAPDTITWYPVALAEKQARRDLNDPGEADIIASFSSEFDFYFGTDGNTPVGLTDFVSVVLHELGHGLGFVNITDVDDDGLGSYGSSDIPVTYSNFIVDGAGNTIFDIDNNTTEMADYLTSNNLFLNAPLATLGNGDVNPKIYAPSSYNEGSSIAHLDEGTYPPGDENTLMTPAIGAGQSALDPGPITMNLFADMGWVHTWLIHEENFAFMSVVDDLLFEVELKTDTTLATSDIVMHYSYDGFETENMVVMAASGSQYSAVITNPGTNSIIEYYFDGVEDDLGRSYRAPSVGAFQENYISIVGSFDQVPLPSTHNFDGASTDFTAINYSGTPFELGNSAIAGKNGTTSGGNAWVTGLAEAEYENDSEAIILSPFYDFTILGDYEISFNTNYSFEDNWDGFIVEYSLDSGNNWVKLRDELSPADWYNQTSDAQSIFGASTPIFSGNTNGEFVEKSTDVSFLSGNESVWFRFVFLTDAAVLNVGMAIDDVQLDGPSPGPVVANFGSENQSGCIGHKVTFSNLSSGSVEELSWDFGMGANPPTAAGVGPHEVTFTSVGTSTVILTANGNAEQDTHQITVTTGAEHVPIITSVENGDGSVTLTASSGDSYKWLRDGVEVENETSQTLTVDDNSDYSVEVTIDGCEGISEPVQVVLGLVDQSLMGIYPNPTSGIIQLNIKGDIEVVNSAGQTIMKEFISSDQKQLDLTSVPDGIYFLKNEGRSVRIVKRKN